MAGHITIVAEQFVIALNNAPWGYANTDHASSSLLSLQEQRIAHLFRHTWMNGKMNTIMLMESILVYAKVGTAHTHTHASSRTIN